MARHNDRDAARFDEEGNTRPTGSNYITNDKSEDGIDRRGFLKCMAWAGTGVLLTMQAGILKSFALSDVIAAEVTSFSIRTGTFTISPGLPATVSTAS